MDRAEGEAAICVIGAGPRGLSIVERICARAAVHEPARRIVVHVVDPFVGVGGKVWRTDQSPALLMNTVASQVSMFTDPSVDCAGPIVEGPTLYEWARQVVRSGGYPAEVRREAARLGPDSYPTRAFYGHYLTWVLTRLRRSAPPKVVVRQHAATAVSLEDGFDGRQIVELDDGRRLTNVDAAVLAQGHVLVVPTAAERELRRYADQNQLVYLEPANPADVDLDGLRPGESVGLRGLGLNFFDYVALLTEVRGGRFVRRAGALRYHSSGKEPVLYAGSRRGVPYHARGQNQKGPFGRHEPLFLTEDVIVRFRARVSAGLPVRFGSDVWPLISKEVRTVYYRALVAERHGASAAEDFQRRYVRSLDDSSAEALLLDHYGIGVAQRWHWSTVECPAGDREFAGHADYQRWLVDHLRGDLGEANRGNVDSPLKAALDVMRDLRNEIRLVVDHAGITGPSYRDELRDWYTPLNAFVSIGPPASRVEEMRALMDVGVLHVIAPGMRADPAPDGAGFVISSDSVPGDIVRVTALVEARLPEVDVRRTMDPLLRNLFARGECRSYRMRDESGGSFETGGLAVTARPYHLLDATDRPHPSRFAFGVPTETVHWATAAGIRPGVNSVILNDADAIAASCLSLAASVRTRA